MILCGGILLVCWLVGWRKQTGAAVHLKLWFYYCRGIPTDTTDVYVHRSVWPLDFASALPTTIHCSGRASHTMCVTSRRATNRSSHSRCSNTNSCKTATVPKSRSRAITCRHTRSRPEIRWDPPQVRTRRAHTCRWMCIYRT